MLARRPAIAQFMPYASHKIKMDIKLRAPSGNFHPTPLISWHLLAAGLRNSIIIELGIGFNIAFSNSIGIGIEIGIAKKSRPVLLLVLVLQFTLSQYWYWYCYRKTHSLSIGIGIVIAKHLQQILSLLSELQINFSSIDVKMASEITLFLDNTVIYKCKITKKGIHKLWKWSQ